MRTTSVWVGRGFVATFGALAAISMFAAPLFPRPLHFVRRVEDPISHQTSAVDQYCAGNRIVDVLLVRLLYRGRRVSTATRVDANNVSGHRMLHGAGITLICMRVPRQHRVRKYARPNAGIIDLTKSRSGKFLSQVNRM